MKTAVLFETFARPDYARIVFDKIKLAKPSKLYFYSNKARPEKEDEIKRNNEIRSYINEIDWDCELHTFFREKYVDVYTSLQSAMDWIFENEEQAIILEEDCVPSLAFFEFCDYFLEKYKNNQQIGFISGDNYLPNYDIGEDDHIISRVFYMFGFATWRDRWHSCNFKMEVNDFLENKSIDYYYSNPKILKFWKNYYKNIEEFIKRTHCWDYEFAMNNIIKKSYGVSPKFNLVQNVGVYGEHSNGSCDNTKIGINIESIKYPFTNHIKPLHPDNRYEELVFNQVFGNELKLSYKIDRKLKYMIKQIKHRLYGSKN